LPFGLCNGPNSFQRLMDILLSGLQWNICLVYLDDLLLFAKSYEEMLERLQIILEKLNSAGLKLRLNKCKFFETEISFLGYLISEKGIKPDETELLAVQNMPIPKRAKDVKSFLGLISYYRKFIPSCAQITQPLIKILKKDVKFVWGEEQQIGFDTLKNC